MPHPIRIAVAIVLSVFAGAGTVQAADTDAAVASAMPKVIEWRRDFHQHPELGNRETRTAGIVAKELKKLGYEFTSETDTESIPSPVGLEV